MIVQTHEGIKEVTDSYGRRMVEMGQAIMLPDYIQPEPAEAEAATEEAATEAKAEEEPARQKKTRKKG